VAAGAAIVKICVVGLWHLGTVTAACLASAGYDVIGLDFDQAVVADLAGGTPPLFEPGLEELVKAGLASGHLRFTTDPAAANADIVWIAYDTPVDDDDRGDVEYVFERAVSLFPYLADGAMVLISSQVPVGTTHRLEEYFAKQSPQRSVGFGYSPENLRLGNAIDAFIRPDRVVVGLRRASDHDKVARLLAPFTGRIEWMTVESAEMTKHALNAFLATSVTFINEVAALCERVGADATEVERGLKSDRRIGAQAYLSPGGAVAGGTLARDVGFLSQLGRERGVATHLLAAVKASNDAHRHWAQRRLVEALGDVTGRIVAVWGLTYKPGTNTLRRSSAVELCQWLCAKRAAVRAHDPAVKVLPPDLAVQLVDTALGAAEGASALVVATPWPEYLHIAAGDVTARMTRRLVIDAGGFLTETLGRDPAIEYLRVGKATS
jgi:UDPglucose 6-dehydrogenase